MGSATVIHFGFGRCSTGYVGRSLIGSPAVGIDDGAQAQARVATEWAPL